MAFMHLFLWAIIITGMRQAFVLWRGRTLYASSSLWWRWCLGHR